MKLFENLQEPAQVLIVGASRGIGLACCEQLLEQSPTARVWAVSRQSTQSEALQRLVELHAGRLQLVDCDARSEDHLSDLAALICSQTSQLNLILHTAGILQEGAAKAEKGLSQVTLEGLLASFTTNACAPLLLLKHLIPLVRGRHTCTYAGLSARVGSIGDNRLGGWYSYRASKAALNQLLHTASIELKRLNPNSTVLSLHPGTTDTLLSKPFQANVPAEKLFTPAFVAERILALIDEHGPDDTGSFWAWDGEKIPW
jgi:NAD(P)-dependent dehydrogenase (short-subunit alcohol dehydrogenase family)